MRDFSPNCELQMFKVFVYEPLVRRTERQREDERENAFFLQNY